MEGGIDGIGNRMYAPFRGGREVVVRGGGWGMEARKEAI